MRIIAKIRYIREETNVADATVALGGCRRSSQQKTFELPE